jgi:hypothetical protein
VVNKVAFFQLFFLWVLTSAPIVFSVLDEMLNGVGFGEALEKMLNIKVMFLYTAAFLAPLLYMLAERLIYPKKEKIFQGAGLVMLCTLIIFFGSAWAYGNEIFESNNGVVQEQFMKYSFYIYALSIYFWFLAITDSCNDGRDFASIVNGDTDKFVNSTRQG